MIAEDRMEVCQEPMSSQPSGLAEWQAHHSPPQQDCLVGWDHQSSDPSLRDFRISLKTHTEPPRGGPPPEPPNALPVAIAVPRRQGNTNHPAYHRRHTIIREQTQDPEVLEAKQQWNSKIVHTVEYAAQRSLRKAAKLAPTHKENQSSTAAAHMQRRHTSEDIQAVPAASAPRCILKSRSTDPDISAVLRRDPRGATMGCDQPIAGPSKPVFSLPPVRPLPGDEREDEDEGAPSSTPTPPPKQRTQQRNVSSASASLSRPKGGYSRFSALSESPSSLHQTTIDQMHSVDSPVFLASTPFEAEPPAGRLSSSRRSARSPEVSDIVPSPVASTTRKAASSSGDMPFPPPPREPHAPLLLPSPVSASSRLPPTLTQSPTLSKPYVMPSSTPGASQVRPVRASQRAPPPLGMRRAHGSGVSKYQVPKERPKAIKGFKIPFKDPQVNGGREASSSASEPQAGAVAAVARAQSYDASAVPDPPHAPATAQGSASVTQPPDQVPQMSARRPEPADGIDEVKEADSSYGDIPFDFDRETLDEVMSIYDG